jgi:hypothetical protein
MNTVPRKSAGKALAPTLLALALSSAIPAMAQDAPAAAQAEPAAAAPAMAEPREEVLRFDSAITPETREVMERMKAALHASQRYSVTAQISRDETLSYGYKLQHNENATMLISLPNRLRVDVSGDIKNRAYYYDGAQFTIVSKDMNVYAKKPVAGNLHDFVEQLLDQEVDMPLIDLLYNAAQGDLLDDVRVGKVVGDTEIDGEPVTHLAFRQPEVDWQLWVSKGAQALPRKILITTRYEVGDPQYQAVMRWNLQPKFADSDFNFVPPKGVTEIKVQPTPAESGGAK